MDYSARINKEVAKYIKGLIPYSVTDSGKGFNKKLLEDPDKLNKWIVQKWYGGWQESLPNIKPPKAISDKVGSIIPDEGSGEEVGFGGGGTGGENGADQVTGVVDGAEPEFEVIDDERFKLDGREWTVQIINMKIEHGFFDYFDEEELDSGTLTIGIDTSKEGVKKVLTESLKKVAGNKAGQSEAKIIKYLIVQASMQEFLARKVGFVNAKKYSHQFINEVFTT